MMNKKGKFIVIEGGDGSGKDEQINLLRQELAGHNIVFTREPGGTEIGEAIRELVLDKKRAARMVVKTELLLFCAARAQHIEEKIEPALLRGQHVISCRFDLGTLAYQIHGRERMNYLNFFLQENAFIVGDCRPDIYILFDVHPKIGLERKRLQLGQGEMTRFDEEDLEFHKRVREGFLVCVKERPHHIIDASKSIEEVWQEFSRAVRSTLEIS